MKNQMECWEPEYTQVSPIELIFEESQDARHNRLTKIAFSKLHNSFDDSKKIILEAVYQSHWETVKIIDKLMFGVGRHA